MKDTSDDNITRKEFTKRLAVGVGSSFLLTSWPLLADAGEGSRSGEQRGFPYTKASSKNDKPNLLLIYTDQQRPFTMRGYGNDFIDTPNLNNLASESIVCKNCYVSQAVCTPSKASIQTGLYPHQHGCTSNGDVLSKDIPTIPELVDDPDYRTAFFGKSHLAGGDELWGLHGYQQFASTEDMYTKNASKGHDKSRKSAYYHWLKYKGFTPPKGKKVFSRSFSSHLSLKYSKSTFLREKTLDFMRKNKDNPFICCVSILNPHTPYYGPLNDYYSPHDIELSPNVGIYPGKNTPLKYRLMAREDRRSAGKKNEESWRRLIARYYGLITQVDQNIGRMLKELERLGLKENTIVAFTSDHGAMLGSHNLRSKKYMYEESCKVPFLLRDPSNNFKQFIIEEPISNVNIVPTLLKGLRRTNVDYSRFPGFSLLDYVSGGSLAHDHAFVEWNPPWSGRHLLSHDLLREKISQQEYKRVLSQSVRTVISPSGWKLCISNYDKNQLYNLQEDPYELNNLYYSGSYDHVIHKLADSIYSWQRRTNDDLNLSIKI